MAVFSQKKTTQLDKTKKDFFSFRLRIYYLKKYESHYYNGEEKLTSKKQVPRQNMHAFTLKELTPYSL